MRWLTDSGVGPSVVVLTLLARIGLAGRGATTAGRIRNVVFAYAAVLFGPLLRGSSPS